MQRIAIDMDEVVADTIAHFLERYNEEFAEALTPAHFHGKYVFEVIEQAHQSRAREYFQQGDFFAEIPVMPGSPEVVEALMKKYEVFITTAAMDVPCSFEAKFLWLRRYFPFIPPSNVVFCGDKSIIRADFLIDDNVRHLGKFGGEGIVYTAPHNVRETRFRRVSSWEDVRKMFLNA